MFVEAIVHPQQPFWVFFWMAIFGLVVSLISIFHSQLYDFIRHLKAKTVLIWNVITHMNNCSRFLGLEQEQLKNPEKWLYPVVEYVDLNRQGLAHDDSDVYVRFQIDSHLLHPINEFYVFVKLYLAITATSTTTTQEAESDWYEIIKPEHYAPIGCLERYRFGDNKVHLLGRTGGEKALLGWMQDFRKGKPMLAVLKIGMKFKKDDSPIPVDVKMLQGNGPRYIVPMNDYRGD